MGNPKKIKVEKVGNKSDTPKVGEIPEVSVAPKFELLKKEAIELGMPKEDVEKFSTEETLEATVNVLKASKANKEDPIREVSNPVEERQVEKLFRSRAERQKAYFDSLDPVTILIPCESGEAPGKIEEIEENGVKKTIITGAVWSKSFNGYRVTIPKGVYTEVPGRDPKTGKVVAVAENIARELNQVQIANEQFGIDRLDPKTGKSVRDQL